MNCVETVHILGWGVAAYSQALRLVRQDKGRLSWVGMVLQTTWRFFMLSARIVALVLLCLALNHRNAGADLVIRGPQLLTGGPQLVF